MTAAARRAQVVGLGLIGGSVGLALRQRGWHVTGRDRQAEVEARAVTLGAVDAVGHDPAVELTVVATPVLSVVEEVGRALAVTEGLVTDVGSTKEGIVQRVHDPRFLGGHPMAGSEQEGLDGAHGDLFVGAPWVLTPSGPAHDPALAELSRIVASLGAEPVTLDAAAHDTMVAVVSHVPHLTAATLMSLADERSVEHRALLRLAAGGFRDMTRIASGHPAIWPDICVDNRRAIVAALDLLVSRLAEVRDLVAAEEREGLLERLEHARKARTNLPTRLAPGAALAELRVAIPDREGEIARITGLAADVGANIHDIEIAHSAEGEQGVLILVVHAERADALVEALTGADYHPSARSLA